MTATKRYTLWTKVIESRYSTRWQVCEDDLTLEKAIKHETEGTAYSIEHDMGLSYMTLEKGIEPELVELERLHNGGQ